MRTVYTRDKDGNIINKETGELSPIDWSKPISKFPYLKKNVTSTNKEYLIPDHPMSTDRSKWSYGTKDSPAAQKYLKVASEFYGSEREFYDPEQIQDAKSWEKPQGFTDPKNLDKISKEDRDYLEQTQGINLEEPPEVKPYNVEESDIKVDEKSIIEDMAKHGLSPDATISREEAMKFEETKVKDAIRKDPNLKDQLLEAA